MFLFHWSQAKHQSFKFQLKWNKRIISSFVKEVFIISKNHDFSIKDTINNNKSNICPPFWNYISACLQTQPITIFNGREKQSLNKFFQISITYFRNKHAEVWSYWYLRPLATLVIKQGKHVCGSERPLGIIKRLQDIGFENKLKTMT